MSAPTVVEDPVHRAYHAALSRALPSSVKLTVIRAKAKDLWVRDMFFCGNLIEPELGDLSGPVVIENSSVRGTQGESAVKEAVGMSVAARYTYERSLPPQTGHDTASGGNILCTPPTENAPLGCILVGANTWCAPMDVRELSDSVRGALGPATLGFLGCQRAQKVMVIDTSWLKVGHVDELVTFIPWRGSRLGFKAAVLSHDLAMDLMSSSGSARILEGVSSSILDENFSYLRQRECDRLLRSEWLYPAKAQVAGPMEQLKKMLSLLGLGAEDIIDLPVLCKMDSPRDSGGLTMPGGPRFKEGCKFVTPNVVNMLVVTLPRQSVLCIPKPYGPHTQHGCAFEQRIRHVLAPSGCAVEFVDDLEACHINSGNIHCSTLELRVSR